MALSKINQLNSKLQQLSRFSAFFAGTNGIDSSIFLNTPKNIDSGLVKNLLKQGLSADTIVEQLMNYSGISTDNDLIYKILASELKGVVADAQNEINNSNNEELLNKKSPISDDRKSWDLTDTANLFSENITKDDFISAFDELNQNNSDDNYYSDYINAISDIGADNFFSALDTDNDGSLNFDEINALLNADEDNGSISADEFNNIYNKYIDNTVLAANPLINQQTEQAQQQTYSSEQNSSDYSSSVSTPAYSPTPSSSGGKSSSYNGGDNTTVPSTTPQETTTPETKETVEDLMKQKEQIKSDSDKSIKESQDEIDTLLETSNADNTLKENYTNAKKAYDDNQAEITTLETTIQGYDLNLHEIDKSLSALDGEKSSIKTDTGLSETDNKNKYRLSAIEAKIKELNTSKQDIETKKSDAQKNLETLKNNDTTLKNNLDNAQSELEKGVSEETKSKIDELKANIEKLKTEKETKISEIDSKIQTLKTKEVEESKEAGKSTGELESNPVGSKFVEDALKYNGMKGGSKFSTGDYGWCADFVTYVVKEVAKNSGMSDSEISALRNDHLGASPQKLVKKNGGHVIEVKDSNISTQDLQKQVKPGMAFICKGGGASGQHTGFVAEVYNNGTFLSIEGNHGNKVCQVIRNLSDMYRYVDFSYLFK